MQHANALEKRSCILLIIKEYDCAGDGPAGLQRNAPLPQSALRRRAAFPRGTDVRIPDSCRRTGRRRVLCRGNERPVHRHHRLFRRQRCFKRRTAFSAHPRPLFPRRVVVVVARHACCVVVHKVQQHIPHPCLCADVVGRFPVHVRDSIVDHPHCPSEQHGHSSDTHPRRHAERYGNPLMGPPAPRCNSIPPTLPGRGTGIRRLP